MTKGSPWPRLSFDRRAGSAAATWFLNSRIPNSSSAESEHSRFQIPSGRLNTIWNLEPGIWNSVVSCDRNRVGLEWSDQNWGAGSTFAGAEMIVPAGAAGTTVS